MDETKVDIDLINGTPVCKVEGDEFLPIQGMTFVQQIEQFFNKQGGKASSPFGDVMLNKKGVKADKSHGMSRTKAATFAAVKDVLEKGKIILPLDYHKIHGKKELTGMVAAPILVGEDKYICVVEVIKNLKEQRLYVHEAFLTKNLQEVVASSHVHDSNDATSRQHQGDIANILINHLKNNNMVSGLGKTQTTDNNKTDKNESKNMSKKNTIRLTESDLKRDISESVKNVLKEYDDNYVDADISNDYNGGYDNNKGYVSESFETVLDSLTDLVSQSDIPYDKWSNRQPTNKYQEINDWANNVLKLGNQLFKRYFS